MIARRMMTLTLVALALAADARAQEPAGWRTGEELVFHTFSIAAIDPATGESGVAVTTRNACVGNGVPWVRKGVGAVATQAATRTEYGYELLDLIEQGVSPEDALAQRLAADDNAASRQIGVIGLDGRSAQHTGTRSQWAGHRAGLNYVAQGNTLVGPEVVDAVGESFESTEGTPRHLADRLIEALQAGHLVGGDARHGEAQSAAVIVADPRPGMARREDGLTVQINVCEHEDPLAEMRRIYNAISETLGFRILQQEVGRDIYQLKLMLHELGYYRPEADDVSPQDDDWNVYTQDAVDAVDRYRAEQGWRTTVPGYVDAATIEQLWSDLEEAGTAEEVRQRLLEVQRIRR
ncbi:MAG: DUF1028 domain-containing protein [Gammaproteobacteria bacterium]|nr:DUF1028 domain-containing protein [Gammaproteobacteria bacterium]MDE0259889.1 DUF1028 domain-containing protein [Gammaproteobacteria bacterium]